MTHQSTQLIKDKIAKLLSEGRLDKTPLDYITSNFSPQFESVSNAFFSKNYLQDL